MNLRRRVVCLGVLLSLLSSSAGFSGSAFAAGEAPLRDEARDALDRATAAMRAISTEGGYLWRYSTDLAVRAGEEKATPTQIWVQPPGTPSMGMLFLRAYEVTGDARYLDAARAAAMALVHGQLESGGWDYLVEFDPAKRVNWRFREDDAKRSPEENAKAKNVTTYDDDNTQSAIRFLLAFVDAAKDAPDPRDQVIVEARDYALRKILEAQYPIGAWPQRWDGAPHDAAQFPIKPASIPKDYPREQPDAHYYGHYTFNDDAHRDLVFTLLDAHRRTGRAEYLAAAKRGADFILLAQLPEPQPVWAQQYNAAMEPAWARAFEPPSVTTRESVGVMRLLVDLYLEFGDEKYMKPIPSAIAWFGRSTIAPDRWARLYELGTNRPIYGDRDKKIHYTFEELSEERRTGYGWRGEFGVGAAIAYFENVRAAGRDRWRAAHADKPLSAAEKTARAAKLEADVRAAIKSLDAQNRWLTHRLAARVDNHAQDWIETGTFIRNADLLCDYLAVTK